MVNYFEYVTVTSTSDRRFEIFGLCIAVNVCTVFTWLNVQIQRHRSQQRD